MTLPDLSRSCSGKHIVMLCDSSIMLDSASSVYCQGVSCFYGISTNALAIMDTLAHQLSVVCLPEQPSASDV